MLIKIRSSSTKPEQISEVNESREQVKTTKTQKTKNDRSNHQALHSLANPDKCTTATKENMERSDDLKEKMILVPSS